MAGIQPFARMRLRSAPPDSKKPGGVRSRLARIRLAGVKKPAEITR